MKINTNNAIKLFFSAPSLQMVYNEAIANSIYAGAKNVELIIDIESYANSESLNVKIIDDGDGFTDKNFSKFSELLKVEDESHKGIGRLVFLNYFKEVKIESIYENNKLRTFNYDEKFEGNESQYKVKFLEKITNNKTILHMIGYNKEKIKSYDYLLPESIKSELINHFFPLFYMMKINKIDLKIKIKLQTKKPNNRYNFYSKEIFFNVSEMPILKNLKINDDRLNLFDGVEINYSISKKPNPNKPIIALSIDNRTIPIDVISNENLPFDYEVIFLLYSTLFVGKVNTSRDELTLTENEKNNIKRIFREKISEILNKEIPQIKKKNETIQKELINKFPHLQGYFESQTVGLIDKNEVLKDAQNKFFNAQKEILEATNLTDKQFEKSLEISARVLTEYILYRNIIIDKISKIDSNSSEADIHNIIVPMQNTFKKNSFSDDLFRNNAWLLDDKYMSYTTILSDQEMSKLINEISIDDEINLNKNKRPDIALIFSSNPFDEKKNFLDVVIVELKKKGNIGLAKKEEVISQLKQRARKLLNYFPNKIQRIWFYGIVDIDKEFEISLLEDEYIRIFSKDQYFYGDENIIPEYNSEIKIPIGVNLLSYDSLIGDAKIRNSTFLEILKNSFKTEIN